MGVNEVHEYFMVNIEEMRNKIQRLQCLSSRSYGRMSQAMDLVLTNKIMQSEKKLKDFKQHYLELHNKRMAKDRGELHYLYVVKEQEKEEYWRLYKYDCSGY